jgi:hypothetical protein
MLSRMVRCASMAVQGQGPAITGLSRVRGTKPSRAYARVEKKPLRGHPHYGHNPAISKPIILTSPIYPPCTPCTPCTTRGLYVFINFYCLLKFRVCLLILLNIFIFLKKGLLMFEKEKAQSEKTYSQCADYIPDRAGCPLTGAGTCKLGIRKKYPLLWPNVPACKKYRGGGL